MGTRNRSGKRAAALFAGVLSLALVVGPASGQEEAGVTIDSGVLVLVLNGDTTQFEYTATDGSVTAQAITTQGCRATLDTSGAVLATVDPIPATSDLGLFDDGLGVQTKGPGGGNGQPCGRADGPDEGLVVALAGDLADKEISFAELDIEGKFDVIVEGELYRDGAKVADAAPLMTGARSDSGPDSADGDNYRWIIDEGIPFDELRLSVSAESPSGAFSLAGGADGTEAGSLGIAGSAFQIVDAFDGIIGCGQPTLTTGDGSTAPGATFLRGDDDDDKNDDPCSALIGYNLSSTVGDGEQSITFEFETDEAPSWFGTFTWTPEPATIPVKATTVDGVDLLWCEGFEIQLDVNGDPVTDPNTGEPVLVIDAATSNPKPVLPDGQSWCLITQKSTLVGLNQIQVTQTIYGETDPDFFRPK